MEKAMPTHIEEETQEQRSLRKALELSGRRSLPRFSLERLKSHVPDDWKDGEADVDEFLASIRGRVKE